MEEEQKKPTRNPRNNVAGHFDLAEQAAHVDDTDQQIYNLEQQIHDTEQQIHEAERQFQYAERLVYDTEQQVKSREHKKEQESMSQSYLS